MSLRYCTPDGPCWELWARWYQVSHQVQFGDALEGHKAGFMACLSSSVNVPSPFAGSRLTEVED